MSLHDGIPASEAVELLTREAEQDQRTIAQLYAENARLVRVEQRYRAAMRLTGMLLRNHACGAAWEGLARLH